MTEPTDHDPFARWGLTFDDVLLQPEESDVIPSQADTRSRVSTNLSLQVPVSVRRWTRSPSIGWRSPWRGSAGSG